MGRTVKPGPLRRTVEFGSLTLLRAQALRLGRRTVEVLAGESRLTLVRLDVKGSGNRLIIEPGARLRGVRVVMHGNNNVIRIGQDVRLLASELLTEGDRCTVTIGSRTTFEPGVKVAAVEEDSSITIGDQCMFSEGVELRTSDSHPIHDAEGRRVNPPGDICIGDHVWIGNGALVLKGVSIANDSIVGARAVVVHPAVQERVVLAGVPARIVRSDVTWSRERALRDGKR
jgi:acetyltransferase-like isoleucine patch superfamily enzyme